MSLSNEMYKYRRQPTLADLQDLIQPESDFEPPQRPIESIPPYGNFVFRNDFKSAISRLFPVPYQLQPTTIEPTPGQVSVPPPEPITHGLLQKTLSMPLQGSGAYRDYLASLRRFPEDNTPGYKQKLEYLKYIQSLKPPSFTPRQPPDPEYLAQRKATTPGLADSLPISAQSMQEYIPKPSVGTGMIPYGAPSFDRPTIELWRELMFSSGPTINAPSGGFNSPSSPSNPARAPFAPQNPIQSQFASSGSSTPGVASLNTPSPPIGTGGWGGTQFTPPNPTQTQFVPPGAGGLPPPPNFGPPPEGPAIDPYNNNAGKVPKIGVPPSTPGWLARLKSPAAKGLMGGSAAALAMLIPTLIDAIRSRSATFAPGDADNSTVSGIRHGDALASASPEVTQLANTNPGLAASMLDKNSPLYRGGDTGLLGSAIRGGWSGLSSLGSEVAGIFLPGDVGRISYAGKSYGSPEELLQSEGGGFDPNKLSWIGRMEMAKHLKQQSALVNTALMQNPLAQGHYTPDTIDPTTGQTIPGRGSFNPGYASLAMQGDVVHDPNEDAVYRKGGNGAVQKITRYAPLGNETTPSYEVTSFGANKKPLSSSWVSGADASKYADVFDKAVAPKGAYATAMQLGMHDSNGLSNPEDWLKKTNPALRPILDSLGETDPQRFAELPERFSAEQLGGLQNMLREAGPASMEASALSAALPYMVGQRPELDAKTPFRSAVAALTPGAGEMLSTAQRGMIHEALMSNPSALAGEAKGLFALKPTGPGVVPGQGVAGLMGYLMSPQGHALLERGPPTPPAPAGRAPSPPRPDVGLSRVIYDPQQTPPQFADEIAQIYRNTGDPTLVEKARALALSGRYDPGQLTAAVAGVNPNG